MAGAALGAAKPTEDGATLLALTGAASRALTQLEGIKARGRIPASVRAEVATVLLVLRPLRTAAWCDPQVALALDEVAESWQRSLADLRAAVIRSQKGECYTKLLVEHGGPPPGPKCTGEAKDVVFYATAAHAAGVGGLGKVAFCRSCRLRHDAKARGVKAASTRTERARARTGQIDLFAERP